PVRVLAAFRADRELQRRDFEARGELSGVLPPCLRKKALPRSAAERIGLDTGNLRMTGQSVSRIEIGAGVMVIGDSFTARPIPGDALAGCVALLLMRGVREVDTLRHDLEEPQARARPIAGDGRARRRLPQIPC